ncbi:MAG: DUF192 domain-containing protein [Salinigranum sp.]
MKRREILASLAAAAATGGCLSRARSGSGSGGTSTPLSYEHGTVTIVDDNGTRLATVRVRIADTAQKRYTGLSDTKSLPEGEGMLFIHDHESKHAYVMRRMDFPLDIVFVDADGRITTIHHAPVPPPGTKERDLKLYRGYGKYVLEVPKGYTTRRNVTVGDRVRISRQS